MRVPAREGCTGQVEKHHVGGGDALDIDPIEERLILVGGGKVN